MEELGEIATLADMKLYNNNNFLFNVNEYIKIAWKRVKIDKERF